MKNFTKAVLIFALALACGFSLQAQQGQNAITQTTLASLISGPAGYSGTSPTISGFATIATCTGVLAPVLPGTPVSILYVGREALGVLTWNSSTCSGAVLRGYLGTQAAPHPSGDMVLIAPAYQTNVGVGANPVPNGFFNVDPPAGSTCSAGVPTNLWLNVLTGSQWLCSTISNTWVPGFINQWITDGAAQTATVPAAAGTVTPSGPLFIISGAGAITGFNIPVGCNATATGICAFTVISAAGSTWTWTAAGNIMTAGTGTAGHTFTFVWSASLQKFVPSSLT
jgi:hypothetical protein